MQEARIFHSNSFNIKIVQEKDFPAPLTKSYHRKEKCNSNKWDSNGKISVIKDTRLEQNYASGQEDERKIQKRVEQSQ